MKNMIQKTHSNKNTTAAYRVVSSVGVLVSIFFKNNLIYRAMHSL